MENTQIPQLRIKERYVNTTAFFKTPRGTEILFDGTRMYTQEQLQAFYQDKTLNKVVEIYTETDLPSTAVKSYDFELLYVNTLKQEELPTLDKIELNQNYEDLTLKELRELFPEIKASSKSKFLNQISDNYVK